jgi:hypothetical protein
MSDFDNLRVRIVKLPAPFAEAMLYHELRANDPLFASVLAQSETLLVIGAMRSDEVPNTVSNIPWAPTGVVP